MSRAGRLAAALGLLATALAGCVTNYPRGRVAFVSTRAIDLPMTVVAPSVVSSGCPVGVPWDQLLARTVAEAPPANALMDVELKLGVGAVCQSVSGTAVRIEPRPVPAGAPVP